MDIIDFAWRPLYLVLRFLLWLAWDFLVLTVTWGLDWSFWRVLTWGRFPNAGLGDFDEVETFEAIVACATGLAMLGTALWFTHSTLNGA
ncbi:hypothetical protein CMZ84_09035 [Lysobacteraceae bacterium NML93-0399]|nr:hypothetical protein CMZ84_09035 [Xanthomonadaceae bacterium NML93-0399]